MIKMPRRLLLPVLCAMAFAVAAQKHSRFKALVLYENGGHHIRFSEAAIPWLNHLAADSNFSVDYINSTGSIDDHFLSQYALFIQLDYPPYNWKEKAVHAFQRYIDKGRGGWIGFHHATLLGNFDGFPVWDWFAQFMGGIRFKNYIAGFADGTVKVEDSVHPCMQQVPPRFTIEKEEWYTWDRSPRPNVKVLASVDETTYVPSSEIKMGDHPVVWTNPSVRARNIYIFMGHAPQLFGDANYTTLFRNAIFWAAGK